MCKFEIIKQTRIFCGRQSERMSYSARGSLFLRARAKDHVIVCASERARAPSPRCTHTHRVALVKQHGAAALSIVNYALRLGTGYRQCDNEASAVAQCADTLLPLLFISVIAAERAREIHTSVVILFAPRAFVAQGAYIHVRQ